MTEVQIALVMPQLTVARLTELFPPLVAAADEFEINTPIRQAAFLAQLAEESGELRYFQELADGSAYEGRKDLGNVRTGDGPKFKGRGPIQLTGRKNYLFASLALGIDLIAHPELVATPAVGFRAAGWFWKSHGLNQLADAILTAPMPGVAFDVVTRRINGALNGKPQRDAFFARARAALGC